MDMEFCWELFCTTGDPMAYVLYRRSVMGQIKNIFGY